VQRVRIVGGFVGALAVGLSACAGSTPPPETMPNWNVAFEKGRAQREAQANASVKVRGIEGTLSSYDVRDTMERRNQEFAACHEPRATFLPVLAGSVEFGIEVHADGKVGRVDVRSSDLGDRVLERCLSEVIVNTPFPRPNGGDANVTYTMMLEPASAGHEPESWSEGRIERLLAKRESTLRQTCGIDGAKSIVVTAYVDPRGRVVTAGAAAREGVTSAQFDCIADDLRSWPMPKPSHRFAKVSFALSDQGGI
jgi:hypothetical protein